MKNILIAGGSGVIGRRLSTLLLEGGYKVSWLSCSKAKADGITVFEWDPKIGKMDVRALENCDAIINLSGASITDPWTHEHRKKIINSRIQSATCLLNALKQNVNTVKVLISSSAVGYYADRGEKLLTENSAVGNGFLAETTAQWENAYQASNLRTILFRIGLVLSFNGGALKEMSKPLPFGICPILGNGKQIISWIHIDDLCLQFIHGIENENMKGIFNAVGPSPMNFREFMLALRQQTKKWSWVIPVPAFFLKLLMGERSTLLLNSTNVSAEKMKNHGYVFQFPTIQSALKNLYGK
ncbi:MAG: TIGR01777 family protein [Bacteroidetes bacterium]|nr:TIGR01777 family protein [Bacteroidota bacterium]